MVIKLMNSIQKLSISSKKSGIFQSIVGELALVLIVIGRGDDDGVIVVGQGGHVDGVTVTVHLGRDNWYSVSRLENFHVVIASEAVRYNDNLQIVRVVIYLWHVGRRIVLVVRSIMARKLHINGLLIAIDIIYTNKGKCQNSTKK